jgi:transcriptional regulator with GAF, ATPase, and Fis domain
LRSVTSPSTARETAASGPQHGGLVVASPQMVSLLGLAERAALCNSKVLLTGESGAGKDLIARHIHAHSPRQHQPFVSVNCAAFSESLLESELFGHVKGSFTGAYRDKAGKVQTADGGTLFLDEIGDMSLRMQALLLRFLENGEIQPVGSDAPVATVDVRVVAATNKNLGEMVAAAQFREDLLYRIRVIHLEVPPLRERPQDIRALALHFAARTGRRVHFTEEAIRVLERHRWPGNVRELQSVVEQTIWLADGDGVDVEQLPPAIRTSPKNVLPARERRVQVADELYNALVVRGYSFWEHIYPLFLARDITRHDMRELVRRGLAVTRGNYRAVLDLFGMPERDYKRFLNFLATHGCRADFREFRNGAPDTRPRPRLELPPLPSPRPAKAAVDTEKPLVEVE